MSVAKTLALFVIAALAAYGFVATLQDDNNFGRILAAYGGIFVAGSLAWGMAVDGFRPDRFDVVGAVVCLVGVGVIMFAPPADKPLDLKLKSNLYGGVVSAGTGPRPHPDRSRHQAWSQQVKPKTRKEGFSVVGLGVAACVACCAGPILAGLAYLAVRRRQATTACDPGPADVVPIAFADRRANR